MLIIVFVLGCVAARFLPPMLVWVLAVIIAVYLAWCSNRIQCEILKAKSAVAATGTDNARRSAIAQRRLLKRSLRVALSQTELRSLFPNVAHGADVIVAAGVRTRAVG